MKKLLAIKLPHLLDHRLISHLVTIGYRETGWKFSVSFNGSKGYLCSVSIDAEGPQEQQTNRICVTKLYTKGGSISRKMLTIFHCSERGVILKLGSEMLGQSNG